jgi:nickel-dependent lactate racemase
VITQITDEGKRMGRKFSTVYAGEELQIEVPEGNLLNVIEPHEKPPLKDPEGKLKALLENPIGCDKLVDLVKPSDKVALISSEYMRMPFSWILAPVVVDMLKEVGVKDENIFLVNAPGTHQTEEQQMANPLVHKLFGPLHGQHPLVYHDCDKRDKLSFVGETSLGTPVWINKTVAACDVKIGFGEVKPHHSGGHCGGGKIINPGVCGRASISSMHRRVMYEGFREHSIGGPDQIYPYNMVRRDMNESAVVAGLDMKIDTLTNPVSRTLVDIFAGDVVEEWEAAAVAAQDVWATRITERSDISLYIPREGSTYMSGAFMYSAITPDMATKDDGLSILVVPAENGYSRPSAHQAFPPKLMRTHSDDMGWRLADGSYDGRDMSLMWQTRKIYDEKPTTIVTKYPKKSAVALGFANVARSVDKALAMAFKEKGKDATISVVYQHNHMYPIYE